MRASSTLAAAAALVITACHAGPTERQPPSPRPTFKRSSACSPRASRSTSRGHRCRAPTVRDRPSPASSAISDELGSYAIVAPPATYTVTLYFLDHTLEEPAVVVSTGHTMYLSDTMQSEPELAPATADRSIPVPGRTFSAALGATAGSQDDGVGVTISSHCGLENTYVIDDDPEVNLPAR
ncbi:MAG: hypothetical protein ABI467_12510 [Kofleriaceae bacterium]